MIVTFASAADFCISGTAGVQPQTEYRSGSQYWKLAVTRLPRSAIPLSSFWVVSRDRSSSTKPVLCVLGSLFHHPTEHMATYGLGAVDVPTSHFAAFILHPVYASSCFLQCHPATPTLD